MSLSPISWVAATGTLTIVSDAGSDEVTLRPRAGSPTQMEAFDGTTSQ